MGPAVLAEQQWGDLDQIAAPDGEIVQALSRVKSVSDFVGRQKFGEFLVSLERRVLPAAADPKLFQLPVRSIRIVEQRFEAALEIARHRGTECSHGAEKFQVVQPD